MVKPTKRKLIMTNKEWLSEWANNVKYSNTEDLHRKIFNEVILAEKPQECEVKYANTDEDKVEIQLISEDSTCSVVLEKR